jgi:hypothetical protein
MVVLEHKGLSSTWDRGSAKPALAARKGAASADRAIRFKDLFTKCFPDEGPPHPAHCEKPAD